MNRSCRLFQFPYHILKARKRVIFKIIFRTITTDPVPKNPVLKDLGKNLFQVYSLCPLCDYDLNLEHQNLLKLSNLDSPTIAHGNSVSSYPPMLFQTPYPNSVVCKPLNLHCVKIFLPATAPRNNRIRNLW